MEGCKGKGTPITKEGPEKSVGGPLGAERLGIAIINYVAQDRPDLAVTARALSQRMASPTDDTKYCLKRARSAATRLAAANATNTSVGQGRRLGA